TLQTKASQKVCLPNPGKEIFKNAPRPTEKNKMTRTDKYGLLNRLTLWIESKRMKSTMPQQAVIHHAAADLVIKLNIIKLAVSCPKISLQ
ncbi:MAG: hypothetical protein R6U11_06140, partial [Bacteroidales bacterium]